MILISVRYFGKAVGCFAGLFFLGGYKLYKKLKRVAFAFCVALMTTASANAAEKIIYVPIDNRPVNLVQVIDVADRLGYDLVTPPEEMLGSWDRTGDPDRIWEWVQQEASGAKAAVLSTDSLIYGSLVASRKHNLDEATIMDRAARLKTLHEEFPFLSIYALSTIMRTPSYNSSVAMEAPYYATYGARIFEYTALKDKEEMGEAGAGDLRKIKKLEADIPAEYLTDWFGKRAKNYAANAYFIDLARGNSLRYLMLGCDDSAAYSQTHKESRHLTKLAEDLGKTRVIVASGADELGMLMVARAINDLKRDIPFLYIKYNEGEGGDTIPAYSNDKISNDLSAAITAVGGILIDSPQRAELVLAVSTNYDGKTFESSSPRNNTKPRRGTETFLPILKELVDKGYPVGLVDIATSNGADNALMNELKKNGLQFRLRAYGGWNTATNSSGFLIGSGVLTKWMSENDIYSLLLTRYLDDWVYQANVRQAVSAKIWEIPGEMKPPFLDGKWTGTSKETERLVREFVEENLKLPKGFAYRDLKVTLPWNRLFECDPRFD